MTRIVRFTAALLLVALAAPAAKAGDHPGRDPRMAWWSDARFGLFIHWGLYAIPAGEWGGKTDYGEWIRSSARIPLDRYDLFRTRFNPTRFDAGEWARLAREAGMGYVVITTKHHDGFCLFDSAQTGFDVASTPFRRDVMAELSAACRSNGLRIGWYYSIMDWHHPDYLPRREWETDRPAAGADYDRYVRYMKDQLGELLTRYGPIGVLWFDGEWESTWNRDRGRDLLATVRRLQPSLIVNNRVGAGRSGMEGFAADGEEAGDYATPEQQVPAQAPAGVAWETCLTMNDHWGWNSYDQDWKPASELIRTLAGIASKGGNLLLNVGPTADGLFPAEAVERLREIGRWMGVNGESIRGTAAGPFASRPWGCCTQREVPGGTRLYLHVFEWPAGGELCVDGVFNEPRRAWLLASPGTSLTVRRHQDALCITLPAAAPDPADTVVVLEVAGRADVSRPPEISAGADIFTTEMEVSLGSDRERVEIRYTLDGTDPGAAAPVAAGPVHLRDTATVSARCFRDGRPVSGTARRTFTRVAPRPAAKAPAVDAGVRCRVFEYEGDRSVLPDFAALAPQREEVAAAVRLPDRRRPERYGCEFSGFVDIPRDGVYHFSTISDDGSRLWIGDTLVVDNDGLHGSDERRGAIALESGLHPLRVAFFQNTGDAQLTVTVSGPGVERQPLAGAWLKRAR